MSNRQLGHYDTFIFDCDGVLLDSNQQKSQVFYEVALKYSPAVADTFLDYHCQHTGVTRFKKFFYLHHTLIPMQFPEAKPQNMGAEECIQEDLRDFAERIAQCASKFEIIEGTQKLLEHLKSKGKKLVVSSGTETGELRRILKAKDLSHYFSQIEGGPQSKEEHLQLFGVTPGPTSLFLGDSRRDWEAAHEFKLHFAFFWGHTEFKNWQNYFQDKDIFTFKNLGELHTALSL